MKSEVVGIIDGGLLDDAYDKLGDSHNVVDVGELSDEELVMVMMPRVSYDAFQALAMKYGGSAAQAMSVALKLLEETLKKNEGV